MKGLMALVLAVGLLLGSMTPALADLDQEGVAKIAQMLQKGEGFREVQSIPRDKTQLLLLKVGLNTIYLIDFKAQACFTWSKYAVTPMDCQRIKRGYPLVAPIITW